jgi:tetratricopeptide (TPR) repeat protein
MRALIDWSYELLPEPQRRVFDDLSIFGNGCTLDSALSVRVGDVAERAELVEILSSLVQKSLIVVDFDFNDARYTLLEATREYAREKLVERGKLEEVARRHASAYLSLAEHLDERWSTSPNRTWHAQARSELENWRIAIHWSIGARNDVLLGQQLILALQAVWSSFALAEGRRWCRYALELVNETTPPLVIAHLEYTEALLGFLAGDLNVALPAAERALDEYRSLEERRGIVKAETIIGRTLCESGRLREGELALADALHIAESIDDPLLAAVAHQGLGLSRGSAGDLDAARDHVANALAIAKAESAERVALVAGMVSAEAHFGVGDKQAAIDLAKDALALARELGDEFSIMRALSNLSTYLLACDRYDEALDAARGALDFSHLAQGATTVAWALEHLAMIAAVRGDRTRAARLFGFMRSQLSKLNAYGDFSEQQELERLRAILECELQQREFEIFASNGAAMSEAEAIAEAMAI